MIVVPLGKLATASWAVLNNPSPTSTFYRPRMMPYHHRSSIPTTRSIDKTTTTTTLPTSPFVDGTATSIATTASSSSSSSSSSSMDAKMMTSKRASSSTTKTATTIRGAATRMTMMLSMAMLPPIFLGGGTTTTATSTLNLQRTGYLLQEMATFATLSALVLNSSLRLWTSTKFHKDQHVLVGHAFSISTALCVIAGSFTAILFQLLDIYSKSALGMGNDSGYISFYTTTALYRKWGFRCFLTETSAFVISFLLNLYNTLWENARVHNPPTTTTSSSSSTSDDTTTTSSSSVVSSDNTTTKNTEGSILVRIFQRKNGYPPIRRVGPYIMIGAIGLTILGAIHIKRVLDIATQYIFIDAFRDKFA